MNIYEQMIEQLEADSILRAFVGIGIVVAAWYSGKMIWWAIRLPFKRRDGIEARFDSGPIWRVIKGIDLDIRSFHARIKKLEDHITKLEEARVHPGSRPEDWHTIKPIPAVSAKDGIFTWTKPEEVAIDKWPEATNLSNQPKAPKPLSAELQGRVDAIQSWGLTDATPEQKLYCRQVMCEHKQMIALDATGSEYKCRECGKRFKDATGEQFQEDMMAKIQKIL